MEAVILSQLVTVQSAQAAVGTAPLRPARSVTRTYPAVPQRDVSLELEPISRPAAHSCVSGQSRATTPTPSGGAPQGTIAPNDLEMSRPASPLAEPDDDGVEALQSLWHPYMNRFRLLSNCIMNFTNGLSDSAAGPLIPYMEKYYDIGYAVVSLIFVGQAIGFIVGAGAIDPLRERFGRAKTLAVAEVLMLGGYIPIVCQAPFPLIVFGFFLIGLGMTLNLALGNIFCGSLQNSTTALGGMHGSYGIGGTLGPLIATAFVAALKASWSRYYLLVLGFTAFNCVFASWAYWQYEKENPVSSTNNIRAEEACPSVRSKVKKIFAALSSKVVVVGALFIFAYQGAEVSISGWVISFLIATRDGSTGSIGYVTSGFWAGITLGRFVLSVPAHKIGEKIFVYGLVAWAAVFELLVWMVPNIIGDAVAVAIVGLLLGPVYPCSAAVFMRTMSRKERLSGMGVISAFGASGGAAAPFTTGLLAQASGTFVLHPIAISLFAVMLVCWYSLPGEPKRNE